MRIALAQLSASGDLLRNLSRMVEAARRASGGGAQIVVFPETFLTGYLGITLATLDRLDPSEIERAIDRLRETALEHGIAIVTTQYLKRTGLWFNNVLFLGRDGELKASYDKNQLVDEDCFHIRPGDPPSVFFVDGVEMSLGLCHDIRYPEPLRWAAIGGSRVHFHPFYGLRNPTDLRDQAIYDAHLTARAAENGLFIVSPNVAVREQMVRSQVRDPIGHLVVTATSCEEQLLICDIDPSLAGDGWVTRRRDDIYHFEARVRRRPFFERAYWRRPHYMIRHDRSLVPSDPDEES